MGNFDIYYLSNLNQLQISNFSSPFIPSDTELVIESLPNTKRTRLNGLREEFC